MPRDVAGDDEKKAMRGCGAAAIRDCLKRPGSRLIIAKTKDRKIGDFEVLADAKQYKKARNNVLVRYSVVRRQA